MNVTLIGNSRASAALAAAAANRPLHAYLLVGPEGVGKRTMALAFAMALNCEGKNATTQRPCRACSACRLIPTGGHPDVITVGAAEGKETIGVEQVREMTSVASLRPYQGVWRVFLAPVERMTGEAFDALLKTLEEPNEQVVIVLTSSEMDSVPETIRSRCQVISLSPVPARIIADHLQMRGVEALEARRLAELARGAPGWAIAALDDPQLVETRDALVGRVAALFDQPLSDRLFAVEAMTQKLPGSKGRTQVRQQLEVMLEWSRDLLLVCAGQPELVVNRSRLAHLDRQARGRTVQGAHEVLRAVTQAMRRVDQNVDPRLAYESMVVAL